MCSHTCTTVKREIFAVGNNSWQCKITEIKARIIRELIQPKIILCTCMLTRCNSYVYLKPKDGLPDPQGSLSELLRPRVIARVNQEVERDEQRKEQENEDPTG